LFNCVPGIAVPFSATLAILQSPTSFASIMVASLYTGSPLTITFIIMFGYIPFIILINILSKTISPALSIIYAICPAFFNFSTKPSYSSASISCCGTSLINFLNSSLYPWLQNQ
jgi:hypothetical protein